MSRDLPTARLALWACAAGLAAATIILFWPGTMIGNTVAQLAEIRAGQLRDWHPPLMAVMWKAMGTTPQSLFVLNALLYWTGIALIADALMHRKGARWGFAALAVGLSPIAFLSLGRIQRDNFMVSLFLIAAGLSEKYSIRAGLIPAALGTLFRTDAIFAFPPLILSSRRWLVRLALCLALTVAMFPVVNFINRSVIGAAPAHAEKSLQLFDIAGIEARSGDRSIKPDVARCYTPFWWDALERDCHAFSDNPQSLGGTWVSAILHHPAAYAAHRIDHFNQAVFFLVPPNQDCRYDPSGANCKAGSSLLKDALARNALLWPITWLVAGLFLLCNRLDPLAQRLAWSAMLLAFAQFAVGVATEFRYFLWVELALQITLLWQLATLGLRNWKPMLACIFSVWLIGYGFRYLPLLL
jgi:hypothetical protein